MNDMTRTRNAVFVLTALALGTAHADPAPLWGPHIDLEAKPGSKRTLGEVDLFLPLSQDARTLVFGNLRARLDNQSSYEGNFGAGVRRMYDGGWNLGAYGYWDHRRSGNGNFFDQATLGAEALGRDWDFRANAYVPVGTRAYALTPESTAAVSGASVQVTTAFREERALKGFDAEAGWRAPIFDSEAGRQLRLYVGGYRFSDAGTLVEGPRLRAELTLDELSWFGKGTRLFLGAEAQKDDARGSQTFLSVRLRIPLGKEGTSSRSLSAQERRMTAPVMRDVDIVTQNRVASTLVEAATQTSGGQTLTVVDSGTTTTTAALNTALANAGANTVVLSGTFNTNAQVTMAVGQTLIGGGSLAVRSASGRTATLSLPGATIAAGANATFRALVMLNDTSLIGMTVTNNYSAGTSNAVTAQNRSGVTIRNSTLTSTGTAGTYVLDALTATNMVIVGNTITANPSAGTAIGIRTESANNITIADNTIATTVTPANKYAITGNNFTVFAAGSTGNVAVGGTCNFAGAPTGSVGFSSISCP